MGKQKDYKIGVYVRLSNEDARAGESVSIENQKLLLTKHVKDMGWELVEIYCDDGFSGTNQNRPALQRMLHDAKQGLINTVLIKDLSRLGRNYLEVGNLAEVFLPEHGCELVSLNEKLDDMMVFRNWFNEQHSKETSKKVKSVKRMCAQNGKYMGTYAPYGYRKSPDNKHKLIIDENAAPTVREIYRLRAQGKSFRAIAIHLNDAGVTPPLDYWYQTKNRQNPQNVIHKWNENSVKLILRSEAYIGNMVQSKCGTVSYKNHKLVQKPREEWIRAEGTHEPIIERDLWERVQALDAKKHSPRRPKNGEASIFTGLLYCADCGFKMPNRHERGTHKDGSAYNYSSFICGSYARSGKSACSIHTIYENVLHELVCGHIREHAQMVECDEQRIIGRIISLQSKESISSRDACLSEIKAHRDRLTMLDRLIAKLYEDRFAGVIPEATFRSLIQKYEQERADRAQTAENLENRLHNLRQGTDDAHTWARLIKRYTSLDALDAETLLLLVDKIIVDEAQVIDGVRVCNIKIIYNYVGDMDWLADGQLQAEDVAADTEAAYGQAV